MCVKIEARLPKQTKLTTNRICGHTYRLCLSNDWLWRMTDGITIYSTLRTSCDNVLEKAEKLRNEWISQWPIDCTCLPFKSKKIFCNKHGCKFRKSPSSSLHMYEKQVACNARHAVQVRFTVFPTRFPTFSKCWKDKTGPKNRWVIERRTATDATQLWCKSRRLR